MFPQARFYSALFVCSLVVGCASAPNVQTLPNTADASQELESTQQMVNDGKDAQLDLFAPQNFERAQKSLTKARESFVKNKDKEKTLESIAESRAWLAEAESRASVTRVALPELSDARNGAIRASAPTLFPSDFKKLDQEAMDMTAEAEKGDLLQVNQQGKIITKDYRNLESKAVAKNFLGEAQTNIEMARKDGAEKRAPKSYADAKAKYESAMTVINDSPRNSLTIAQKAGEATAAAKFLVTVTQKTKQGNTEDLVVQSEKQKRAITGLSEGVKSTEGELKQKEGELNKTQQELEQKQALLDTAAKLRSQLPTNQAEVYADGNAIKVRLKGLSFASNQAVISKKNAALLNKVDKALGTVGVSQITVESYTDSVGTTEKNKAISEQRAQAVQKYLVSNGQVPSDKIKAVGKGEEDPISDNTTAKGRAENRRVDLVIEPAVAQ